LTPLQVGRYAEYLAKMEFTLYGFQVYTSEVDDRGIDFVARRGSGPFIEVQVKSARNLNYVFMKKAKFPVSETLSLVVVLLLDGQEPDMYLIPSTRWRKPDSVFVDRDYVGLQSPPEYGINLSRRNMPSLSQFAFPRSAAELISGADTLSRTAPPQLSVSEPSSP
jgi:hypothetical protein